VRRAFHKLGADIHDARRRLPMAVVAERAFTSRSTLQRIEAGIRLVYQPPYTPEVQPAEHLWPLVDEPIVNKHIASLDHLEAVVASRCCDLADDPATEMDPLVRATGPGFLVGSSGALTS
jgi:hypothetical protein